MPQSKEHFHKIVRKKLLVARQQVAMLEKTLASLDNISDNSIETEFYDDGIFDCGKTYDQEVSTLSIEYISEEQTLLLDILGIGVLQCDLHKGTVVTSVGWDCYFGHVEYDRRNPLKTLYSQLDPKDLPFVVNHIDSFLASEALHNRITVRVPQGNLIQWIDIVFIVQRALDNSVEKISCFAQDLTYFKEKELFFKKELDILNDAKVGFPSISLYVDSQLTIIDISPSVYHYTDINPETIKGIPLKALFDQATYAIIREKVLQVLETNEPAKCMEQLTLYNRNTIPAALQLWPEKGTSEHGDKTVNILIWDKQSTHYLIENFYTLFSNMVDGFAIVRTLSSRFRESSKDSDPFTIIVMNQALGNVYETNFREYVGQSLKELVGDDMEQWEICLEQVVMHQKPVVYCMKSKKKPILLEICAFPTGLDSIACIVKDVTALHAAEQAVLLNEARASALYRFSYMYNSPITTVLKYALTQIIQLTASEGGMIVFYDLSTGKYELWSQGLSEVEVRTDLTLEDLRQVTGFEALLDSSGPNRSHIVNTLDEPFVCSNGKQGIRYMVAPIYSEGKLVCLARVSNKSSYYEPGDLRQMELFLHGAWFYLRRRWAREFLEKAKEEAEKAKDEAEKANRSKNVFLANVSHEVRTPLNAILGMLQLLEQSSLEEEQQEWVHIAIDASRGLMRIIADILNIARIEAGHYEMVPLTFNMSTSLQSILSIYSHRAEQKNIDFNVSIDSNIPPAITGDEELLRQIILNLVGNAFKFTNSGKICFECSLLPVRKENAIYLYFAIHDTGIGIAEEKLASIFMPFTQIEVNSSTRKSSGVGLGLSIVHRLVSVMGGSLCVESTLNEGTSFHLSFPFAIGNPSELVRDTPSNDNILQDKLAILVAEDDPVNQFTIKTMLKKMGHEVFCVENGIEALEALQLSAFHCVITDIQMPDMDGEELIIRIRKGNIPKIRPSSKVWELVEDAGTPSLQTVNPNVPIVILSAHVMTDLEGYFIYDLGADYYIEKPINIHNMSNILEQIAYRIKGLA